MSIPNLISFISIIVWLLPPFKQRGTKYFLFFTLLAICDPMAIVLYLTFHISTIEFYPVVGILCFYSLTNKKIGFKLTILGLIVVYLLLGKNLQLQPLLIFNVIFQTLIFIIVVKEFLVCLEKNGAFNVFLLLLISYQIITIYKMMVVVSFVEENLVINYLSSFIQLFYGIVFTKVNIETKPLLIKISNFNKK